MAPATTSTCRPLTCLPALTAQVRHGRPKQREREVTVWGSGTPRREFLYVDDLADALCFLMERYDSAEIINVGWGEDITIARARGVDRRRSSASAARIEFDRSKPDGTPRKLLDVGKLHALGWHAKTTLADGIRRTYDWYLANADRAPSLRLKTR